MTSFGKLVVVGCILTACRADGDPGPLPPQVRRILSDETYEWRTMESPAAQVHFPVGSYAEAQQGRLLTRVDSARNRVSHVLGQAQESEVLHFFYVDNRDDMEALTGAPVTGYSYFRDNAVVLVFNADWQPFERHELTHVVTLGSWPPPGDVAVVEGLATYVQGDCGGFPNVRVARTIREPDGLIPLDLLATDFRKQNDLIAYLQAASIIDFLIRREGEGILTALWEQGLGAAPNLSGMTTPDFMSEFRTWLEVEHDPVPDPALRAIRQGGCGSSGAS